MATYAGELAAFITGLNFADIPQPVVENVKLHLLDSLGISLAARRLATTRMVLSLVREMGGQPQSSLLGYPEKVPAANAALANGVMAHSFDYDDTHSATLVHASSCVAPIALAAAEANGLSGRETILLATIGYELITRLGLAAPGQFHARGFHTTSICGTFAAAAMGARAMSLSPEETAHALGIAGSQTAGLLQCVKDGTWVKLLHPGWAGHAGLIAAALARRGFTGPGEVFEGELGVYNSFLRGGAYQLGAITAGLGTRWETPQIAFKLYPTCHFTHAYLDCVYALKGQRRFVADEVADIECIVPAGTVPIICEPQEAKRVPDTEYGARFSLYFCVAAALLEDSIRLDTFDRAKLHDWHYLALAAKVRYSVQEFAGFPQRLPGWVIIRLQDGTVWEHRVDSCKGPYGEPITQADVIRKFMDNTASLYSEDRRQQIVAQVLDLENAARLDGLLKLCVPGTGGEGERRPAGRSG